MNTTPRFKIGDRVQRQAQDEEGNALDVWFEGIVFGVSWNPSGWSYTRNTWVYFVRWVNHPWEWLPDPFWDEDPIAEDELKGANLRGGNIRQSSASTLGVAHSTYP
jgi:hypothetical protein